jgi:glycosyltransferase involved in cell wall biosynthesis
MHDENDGWKDAAAGVGSCDAPSQPVIATPRRVIKQTTFIRVGGWQRHRGGAGTLCDGASQLLPSHRASCKAHRSDYLGRVQISVIVPAFNEEKLLGASLAEIRAAAAAFTRHGWGVELIVCDNNSTDRTADIARAAGAKVVFEPVNQIARARNAGAAAATGAWLIFVDADTHPSADLFADVAEQISSGNCVAGGATIRMDENILAANVATELWNWTSRIKKWMAGSFIFVETAAFRELGGFSHEHFAAEELDLSQRLKKLARLAGKKIVILHRHPIKTSARKLKLYTPREMWAFFFRSLFNHRRTVRSREQAYLWYDGRR